MTREPAIEHAYGHETRPYTIGVEEEFQLLHAETFDLTSRIDVVLAHATEADKERIRPELMQSVVESATTICANAAEAQVELVQLRRRLVELAEASGCVLGSAGTHPFSRYEFQKVTDRPRYADIISRLKWIAQRELIYGLHVHVGVDTPDKAIAIFNTVRTYLPHFLALSVNSPFWQGRHTGLQSSRVKVFDSFPRSGMPEGLPGGWAEYKALMERAIRVGCFTDTTYVWWDVRPHPRYGTVEIRICDAQTTVQESVALAALVQATCAWLGSRFDEGEPVQVHPRMLLEENKWRAARYGLQAEFIDLDTDTVVPVHEALDELISTVEPFARKLGSEAQLALLDGMLQTTGAERQLKMYKDSESLLSVAQMLAEQTVTL